MGANAPGRYDDLNEERNNVLRNMVSVAEALERPGLSAEQQARGKTRFDELERALQHIHAKEADEAERRESQPVQVQESINRIRETLKDAKKGVRR